MVGSPPVIRVFIVAGIRLYRDGLAAILPRRDGIAVVGTAATWEAGAAERPHAAPGHRAARHGASPAARTRSARSWPAPAARRSSRSPSPRASRGDRLRRGGRVGLRHARAVGRPIWSRPIESAARGQVACSPRVAAALLHRVTAMSNPAAADSRLTRRESEIATLLDEGLSNKEIAQRLCIERATVKNHVHNILEKLEVHSRVEVAERVGARPDTRPHPV